VSIDDSGEIVPFSEDEEHVRGYIREGVQEAEGFYRQQYGYGKMDIAQKMVMGEYDDIRSADLSNITDNEYGSIGGNLKAQLTDTRPFLSYSTQNHDYDQQGIMLNNAVKHWWLEQRIDMRFADAISGCLTNGSAALWTTWDPSIREFRSRYVDCRDALVVRPTSPHSYQDCKMLIMREEMTLNSLRQRFPDFASRIVADRDGSPVPSDEQETYTQRVIAFANKSPFSMYKDFISKPKANMSAGAYPVADLYTAYVHDDRINESSSARLMGPWSGDGRKPRRNWSYRVEPGERLYPYGRVVVMTNSCRFYDGPNNYWHGQFPVSKLTLDQWPFARCYFGKAPMWDLIDWQRELNKTQRAIADYVQKFVEPDLIVDQNAGLSRSSAEKMRTRKAGGKFYRRPGPGKGFELEYPPPMPPEISQRPAFIIGRMRSLAGSFDMANVLNKGQLPAAESTEAITEMMTGATRMRSRTLEAFIREFAMQMAFNICQYWTQKKRLRIMGPKGLTVEDFDPTGPNLIPVHIGDDFDKHGALKPERHAQPRPARDRARDMLNFISFDIAPNSMLNSARFQEQMKYLQLARGGFVDPMTAMEHMDVPNLGDYPPDPATGKTPQTIMERLIVASKLNLMGQVSAAGRKSSGQNPPQLKSSGAVSEST